MSSEKTKQDAVKQALELLVEAGAGIQAAIGILQGAGLQDLAQAVAAEGGVTAARDEQAYLRLQPKLIVLSDTIDAMTEDEYGEWVNALPREEFIEFIGVAHDSESFNAAVAAAKECASAPPAAPALA